MKLGTSQGSRGLILVREKGTIVRIMRTTMRSPVERLFPKARRRILAELLTDPGRRYYLREVAQRTGCPVSAAQRELSGLTAAGVLTRTREGNRTYFQANRACPFHAELRGLMLKTLGLADVLRSALAPLADRIRVAFVYGSIASGDPAPESDVDVFVVGRATFADVAAALAATQQKLSREVNPAVYPAAEFRRKAASGHHFVRSVLRGPKVFLIGDENELAGLGAKRLAQEA